MRGGKSPTASSNILLHKLLLSSGTDKSSLEDLSSIVSIKNPISLSLLYPFLQISSRTCIDLCSILVNLPTTILVALYLSSEVILLAVCNVDGKLEFRQIPSTWSSPTSNTLSFTLWVLFVIMSSLLRPF